MRRPTWAALLSLLLLASCGGGDPQPSPSAMLGQAQLARLDGSACQASSAAAAQVGGDCLKVFQPLAPQRDQAPQAAPTPTVSALFAWAQGAFPQFFGGTGIDGTLYPYTYRYYRATDTFLAVDVNSKVYVLGPLSDYEVMYVGALSDFSCMVYPSACQGGGGGGGSVDWESSFSATEIIDESPTLALNQRQGWTFSVTGGNLPAEVIFAAQYSASLYITSASDVSACINGRAFSYYPEWSFLNQYGYQAFTLPPGTYGACLVNGSSTNSTRIELQNQPTMTGFSYSGPAFNTVTRSVSPGGRLTQPVTAGATWRTLVDGANSGGEVYIIPASQQSAFLAGNSFNYVTNMSCGTGADKASPGLCEITGVGDYAIAYRNNTGSTQSVVMIGRNYVPN